MHERNCAAAEREGRLIVTEYPYHPRVRRFQDSLAGRRLIRMLEESNREIVPFWLDTIGRFLPDLNRIQKNGDHDAPAPFWLNGMLPGLDAMLLYALVRELKPRTYIEVGSGNSTKFVRRAIEDGGLKTRLVSIDPRPRAAIDTLCDEVIRLPHEDVDEAVYGRLMSGDIVYIDNSHRSFQNSDVTVFFTEMLPALPAGVTYGIHDIFLPSDYPEDWRDRFYNEQYLLVSYLLGGADGDEVIFPGFYASANQYMPAARPDVIGRLFAAPALEGVSRHANAFWMRRRRG